MTIFDLLIIYFSCGSPFAVSSYLGNRKLAVKKRWILNLSAFLFWPGIAILRIKRVISEKFKSNNNSFNRPKIDSKVDDEIAELRAGLDAKIGKAASPAAVFKFRAFFDRYVGLSLAFAASGHVNCSAGANLLEVSGHENIDLGNICLNRRNRWRLHAHKENARVNFINAILRLSEYCEDSANILSTAGKLARILNDNETALEFDDVLVRARQNQHEIFVESLEKEVWTPQRREPAHINQI